MTSTGREIGSSGAKPSAFAPHDPASVLADALEQTLLAALALSAGVSGREAALDAIQAALAALTGPRNREPRPRAEDLDAALRRTREAIQALLPTQSSEAIATAPARTDGSADRSATQIIGGLRGVLEGLEPLHETALSDALAGRTTAPEQRLEARSLLRASRGEPSLHAFERAPILALVGLEGRDRRFSLVRGAGEEEQVRRLARDCMEDIALLGDLRRRGENEPWTAVARFEQRLLDNLDALAALACGRAGGGVIAQLQRYAAETSFPDRGRAFARAFVLACVEGDDAIRAAVMALRRADPSTLEAYQTALSLGSSPAIGPTMERLLWSEKPALMRFALEVLRRRGEASPAVVALLLEHPDPRVVAAAARAAGAMTEDRATITALLEPRLDDADDEIAIAVAEALLVLGSPAGLSGLRARLRDEADAPGLMPRPSRARATRLLALGGGPEDLGLLLAVINGDPIAAEALGWLGHTGAIDPLIAMLERAGTMAGEHARTAQLGPARALHRITGAGLRGAGASVEALDGRLVLDVGSWRAIREELSRAPAPSERLRFGSPCTVMATIDELLRDESSPVMRRDAALELALAIGPAPRIEVDGWATRQQATLEALREHFGATPATQGAPGEWPANRLARRAAAARRCPEHVPAKTREHTP